MKEFDALIEVANRLNGPNGCPWDLKQTFASLCPYVLEEAHEVMEAVDANDPQALMEELGDLLYITIFYAKLAEKMQVFSLESMLEAIKTKLIRRHPHVFGDEVANTPEEVLQTWNRVKKTEKKDRKSPLDGIPSTLPVLQRAQKVLKNGGGKFPPLQVQGSRETELAYEILQVIEQAHKENIDMESALRKALTSLVTSSEN